MALASVEFGTIPWTEDSEMSLDMWLLRTREVIYAIANNGSVHWWDTKSVRVASGNPLELEPSGIVAGVRDAVQVVGSMWECLVLDSKGRVFVSPSYQGLFQNKTEAWQQVKIEAHAMPETADEVLDNERLQVKREMTKVEFVACGDDLCIFLTPGAMFLRGKIMLQDDVEQQEVETPFSDVFIPTATNVRMVAIGSNFILLLNEDGSLCRYANRNFDKRDRFVRDEADDKYVFIACKHKTALAITRKGRLYTFGENLKGQLGHGGSFQEVRDRSGKLLQYKFTGDAVVDEPRLVPFKSAVRMAAVENYQIVVVTEEGKLFASGFNNHGQLALGLGEHRLAFPKFKQVVGDFQSKNSFTSVALSLHHIIALTHDGRVVLMRDHSDTYKHDQVLTKNLLRGSDNHTVISKDRYGLYSPGKDFALQELIEKLEEDVARLVFSRIRHAAPPLSGINKSSPLHDLHGQKSVDLSRVGQLLQDHGEQI